MLEDSMHHIFECAYPSDFKHTSKNPIGLSCGHFICKECIPNDNNAQIKCCRCDKVNQTPLDALKSCTDNEAAKVLFNKSMKQMFNYITNRFKDSFENLKG